MSDKPETAEIEDAVECGIECAADYVASRPMGQRAWGAKEYGIARAAARATAKAMKGERYVSKD